MTFRVMFTPLASADIEAAYNWYEAQRPGMGEHFRTTLSRLWLLLEQFPHAGPEAPMAKCGAFSCRIFRTTSTIV